MSSLSRRSIGWLPTNRLWLIAGLVIGFILIVAGESVSATEPEHDLMPPLGKGVFVVASPNLTDPNFRQAVVLICEFSPEGTLGLIVNRPTNVPLSEAMPQIAALKDTSHVLFAGGPVQPNGILMLFRVRQEPAGSRRVFEEVYLGGNTQTLERVLTHPEPTETFRAFAGYAGWAPGQLEFEMALGSWATVQADARTIFEKEAVNLWSDMLRGLSVPRVIHSRVVPGE